MIPWQQSRCVSTIYKNRVLPFGSTRFLYYTDSQQITRQAIFEGLEAEDEDAPEDQD